MELTNVQTEEELYQKILDDMLNYNKNSKGLYDDYIGIFQNFLAEYKSNLEELQRLKEQELTLTSANSYLGKNNIAIPTATNTGIIKGDGYHFDFSKTDKESNTSEDKFGKALEAAKWGDVDTAFQKLYERGQKMEDPSYKGTGGGTSMKEAVQQVKDELTKAGVKDVSILDNLGYSSGIERGPVTYTGLAMLHGTPSAPEYVLNNDQAYNLLYNMSSARIADFETISKEDSGIQYIVQGDIILEGIEDPAKFWQEVTNAMGNRWNVTKNK